MHSFHPRPRRLTGLCAPSLLPPATGPALIPTLVSIVALSSAFLLVPAQASAQVVTNSQALDALAGKPETSAPATAHPAAPHPAEHKNTPAPKRPQPKPAREPALTHPAAPAPGPSGTGASGPQGTVAGASAPPQAAPSQPPQHTAPTPAPAQTPASAASAPTPAPASAPGSASASTSTDGGKTPASAKAPTHPAPPATIPLAPPPVPQLTPAPPDVEVHPFPIPAQPAIDEKAVGAVSTIPGGIRLTFAAGAATLNPATHQALLAFGQSLSEKPHVRALIDAYSSGAVDDPSMPRRMALSRGLAARSVLMNGGIPSTRIYLRVIGLPKAPAPDGGQDYIDIYQSDAVP